MTNWRRPIDFKADQELMGLLGDPSTEKRQVELIEDIAQQGEPSSLKSLLTCLNATDQVRMAAMRGIDRVAGEIPASKLPKLSRGLRGFMWSYWEGPPCWNQLEPDALTRFDESPDLVSGFWGVMSLHPSGYVRESALDRLTQDTSGQEIRYLLLRANDWVEPVREKAIQALIARLKPRNGPAFAETLELIGWLRTTGRGDKDAIFDGIEELLTSASCRDILVDKIRNADRETARHALSIAADSRAAARSDALPAALERNDAVLNTRAIEAARRHLPDDELVSMLARHRDDSNRFVRRAVLEAYVERLPNAADEPLEAGTFDENRSVRQFARFHLSDRSRQDFLEEYRAALETGNVERIKGGLRGLADLGEEEDKQRIAALATHQLPSIRRTALRELNAIGPREHLDVFWAALRDREDYIPKTAAKVLGQNIGLVSPERLVQVYEDAERAVVRKACLYVVPRWEMWVRIDVLLQAARVTEEPALLEEIDRQLPRWNVGVAVFPPRSQERSERILAGLDATAGLWDSGRLDAVRDIVSKALS